MWDSRLAVCVLLLVAALLAGCSNDWRTDMWYQPSIRPEEAPRPQPEHSVPLGAAPVPADRDDAESLTDPVPASSKSIARGAALFHQRCLPCHGPEGHGGGPVSKFFPAAPDLAFETIRNHTDGYLWGTITFGGRAMPPQPDGLTPGDRWDIVNFVRVEVQHARPGGESR